MNWNFDMYSPSSHMASYNAGQRSTGQRSESIYTLTFADKVAGLQAIADVCDGTVDASQTTNPRMNGSTGEVKIAARCRWDTADVITLELSQLSLPQAIAAIRAIQGCSGEDS